MPGGCHRMRIAASDIRSGAWRCDDPGKKHYRDHRNARQYRDRDVKRDNVPGFSEFSKERQDGRGGPEKSGQRWNNSTALVDDEGDEMHYIIRDERAEQGEFAPLLNNVNLGLDTFGFKV